MSSTRGRNEEKAYSNASSSLPLERNIAIDDFDMIKIIGKNKYGEKVSKLSVSLTF